MKKHELAYIKELAEKNDCLSEENDRLSDHVAAYIRVKSVLKKRVNSVLKQSLKYYNWSLEEALRGPGFPLDELIDIFDIDVSEVEEAIEQHNKEAKEESEE